MIYYLIRHKASGKFMPQAKKQRGYSNWNPSNPDSHFDYALKIPRLIETEKKANRIIAAWNANPNAWIDGRSKEDLEVVKVALSIVKKKEKENDPCT